MIRTATILQLCAGFSALAAMQAAHAQEAPAAEFARTAATDGGGDIVVTARRREEVLQDVPISVSVLSGEQLIRSGVDDMQGLQYRTPSLSLTSGGASRTGMNFAMRGQRSQESQLFTDPPVGTYFAEVVQPRSYGFGNSLYDLQSVQVLKGVQGTLFGRNMTGGAVLVEPQHPKLGEFSGEVRAQYGSYDLKDLYGVVNIPLGDQIAFRIAGKTRERDGWAREVTTGRRYDNQNFDTFRVSALVSPFDGLESLTIFDWYRSDDTGTAAFATALYQPSLISNYEGLRAAGLITDNIPAQFANAQALFRNKRFTFDIGAGEGGNLDVSGAPYGKTKTWGITNKTTWELSDTLTLKNIFGYRKLQRDSVQDFDGLPVFLITPHSFARTRNISEELQLQGKALEDRLNFVLGAFYFDEKGIDGSVASTLPQINIAGAGLNPQTTPASLFLSTNPGQGYSRTAAAFAAGTFHVTPELSLSGGIRYNYDKRKITVSPRLINVPNPDGSIGRCSFDIDAATPGTQTVPYSQCSFTNQKSFKEWTYDATVQYEPSDRVTTYVSYRHGFRAGGFSTRATSFVTLQPFLPEFVDEYEIGLKTNTPLGSGRLTTSTALFRQDGSDVQKQRSTLVNGNVFTIIDNTAKQRNSGGEFEATLNVDNFALTGYYAYTKVKIRKGRGSQTLATPTGPVTLLEFDQRGSPRHQLGLTGTINLPVAESIGEVNLIANWTWRSKILLEDFEIESTQPSYSLINLRAEWNDIGRSGISLAAFVNNATNETYRIGVLGLIAEGLGFESSAYGEPRMYGIEVGFRF